MKKTFPILVTVLSLTVISSCKTKEIVPVPPTLDTITVAETTFASVLLSCAISNVGNQSISDYGFVYSETNATPTLADSRIAHGAVSDPKVASIKFSDVVKGLKPSTNYFARSYSVIASGTVFGPVMTFKTADVIQPAIKTDAVILVFTTSAKLRGIVETKGSFDVSEYGICWSSTNNLPTTTDSKSGKTNISVFPTIYTVDATNLTPNTAYYFRAFVVSNGVTTYGDALKFNTLAITQPTIKTLDATTTSTTSVKINGVVESGGNSADITEYGICWSQRFSTPTTEHSKAKIPDSIMIFPKTFSVNIYSLNSNIEIFYRAYVISNGVVSYGDIKTYKLETEGFPTLTTGNATHISATSQKLNGTINTRGNYAITEYGVCWFYINDFSNTLPITCISGATIQGSPTAFPATFSIDATNLNAGTLYIYRAFVVANGITTYGNERIFFKEASPN
ncbi:hypothetical protein [Emticicia sp. TH156]|uniref:hypothetical protein n=1 Tax=Emticicia sp. TH156 TaxID=2067454 RepID=UPI000C792A34|nr:hypothetical protein [Emticicia sp. TH156]PLK42457.1 hypothetical protein C0V77_20820 [Emticicia sp. TH156]